MDILFYEDEQGEDLISPYIKSLDAKDKMKVYNYLELLEAQGHMIREPHSTKLEGFDGLFELRPIPHRLFYYYIEGNQCVILHCIHKKDQKTRRKELVTASQRKIKDQNRRVKK